MRTVTAKPCDYGFTGGPINPNWPTYDPIRKVISASNIGIGQNEYVTGPHPLAKSPEQRPNREPTAAGVNRNPICIRD
jgi:hypothetical protein